MRIMIVMAGLMVFLGGAQAQSPRKFGLGFILGSPSALSAKYFVGQQEAYDAALSFSDHHILLWGDYLRHFPGVMGMDNAFVRQLTPYIGAGPFMAFRTGHRNEKRNRHYFNHEDDSFALGARIPFGLEWMSTEIPLGVALEIAPGIAVLPSTSGLVQAGLALRYYF